ncbi:hypothetical protein V491_07078 [Pseudogymnoascus sp. VKM F-3775]|nr:hypothetical protein V491_07078 [Pseudogymnoascus sp. VKM F-3775]
MLFSKVLPLTALASLAAAQDYVARFKAYAGAQFDITTDECINFERSQPIYNTLEVTFKNLCELNSAPDCGDEPKRYYPGLHEITYTTFASIHCHPL